MSQWPWSRAFPWKRKRGSPPLAPVVVAASGRSGTTLLMQILATSPQIAFDRIYAYENAYIAYLLTWAKLPLEGTTKSESWRRAAIDHPEFVSNNGVAGGIPWSPRPSIEADDEGAGWVQDVFPAVWEVFSKRAAVAHEIDHGDAIRPTYYAETAPLWVLDSLSEIMPSKGIHLVRDPRDQWSSIMAFNEKRGRLSFGVQPTDTPESYAARFAQRQRPLLERAARMEAMRPSDRFVLRYEDLVLNTDEQIDLLSSWLGVRLEAPTPTGDGHVTARTPSQSVGRWIEDMPPAVSAILERELGDLIDVLDYR